MSVAAVSAQTNVDPMKRWRDVPLAQWDYTRGGKASSTVVQAVPDATTIGGRNVIYDRDLQPKFRSYASLEDAVAGAQQLVEKHPHHRAYGVLTARDEFFAVGLGSMWVSEPHPALRTITVGSAVVDGRVAAQNGISNSKFTPLTPDLVAVVGLSSVQKLDAPAS